MSESNGFATREALIGKASRRYIDIRTPSGHKVRLQSLSEGEMAAVEADRVDYKKGGVNRSAIVLSRARMITACVVDGEGHRIFTDGDAERIAAAMDSKDAIALYRACNEHTGCDDDFEELVKNSETALVEDSPSS